MEQLNFYLDQFSFANILLLISVFILTFINWSVELIKWNNLINKVHKLDRRSGIISILLGISANLIAPNRTGDLAGRLRYIPPHKRWRALYINFFSATSQLMVTLLMGLIAFSYLIEKMDFINQSNDDFIEVSIVLIITLSILLYFRSNTLLNIFKRVKGSGAEFTEVGISFSSRLNTLVLSFARYCIFLLQFYLALNVLGLEISFVESSLSLAIIFFVNSFLPSNLILELLSKGTAVFFIFQLLGYDPIIGISATVVLWLFNVGIPALIGIYFIKDLKWLGLDHFKKVDP